MPDHGIRLADICPALPPEWAEDPRPEIRRAIEALREKVVVLDDDPTGTQTVHDVPVLTEWSVESLAAELANDLPVFYILTNSRSVPLSEAQDWNRQIARNLTAAADRVSRRFVVISRSDSTLRGHFPGEVEALIDGLGLAADGILLIPFFLEGGRYTLGDIHYAADGELLIPVAETEFAKDPVFGYRNSNLRDWVEEKTGGRVSAQSVQSVSLDTIRRGGPAAVARSLCLLSGGAICIVNAASPRDLDVFTQGLLQAERAGKRFLYRTAASFVPARCGLAPRKLLTAEDVALGEGGGLIVVGSFVPRTSTQIEVLLAETDSAALEVDAPTLLDTRRREGHIEHLAQQAAAMLRAGRDAVVRTSPGFVAGASCEESLRMGRLISESLVDLVRAIPVRPRYFLAKGGITSSNIATAALGVRRAMVRGQVLPGVPVWELGPESRYPKLPYVVFPGNVGDSRALLAVVRLFGSAGIAERATACVARNQRGRRCNE